MDLSNIVSLDFETGSLADLRKVGAWNYAEDPSTRIICMAYKLPNEKLTHWKAGMPAPMDLLGWVASGGVLSGWNVTFEWLIWNRVMTRQFPNWKAPHLLPEQLIDTMAVAANQGLPLSLDMAGQALPKLGVVKDKSARALMLRMSRPRAVLAGGGLEWWDQTDPAKLDALVAYCEQDVRVERAILRSLPEMRASEREIWLWDLAAMNHGIRLDRALVGKMKALAKVATVELDAEMARVTGSEVPNTRAVGKLLNWARFWEPKITSLGKDQLAKWIAETKYPELAEALRVRQSAAKSSVAKLVSMESYASGVGSRMRGLTQYYGAMRTGRWCLPAETPVLVRDQAGDREVPITEVTRDMQVWDGTAWVAHEGVVFSGYHPVISHDGVVATTEHRVYVSDTESVTLAEAKATDRRLWRGLRIVSTDFPERGDVCWPDEARGAGPVEGPRQERESPEGEGRAAGPCHSKARAGKLPVDRVGASRDCRSCTGSGASADRGIATPLQRQRGGRGLFGKLPTGGSEVESRKPTAALADGVSRVPDGPAGAGGHGNARPPLFEMGRSPLDQIGEVGFGKIEHQEKPAGSGTVGNAGPVGSLRQHRQGAEGPTRDHDTRGTGRADGEGPRGDCSFGRGEGRAPRGDQEVLGRNAGGPGKVCRTESPQERVGKSRAVPTYDIVNAGPRNRFMAWGRVVSNSGRGPQVQNYPRGSVKNALELVRFILGGGDPEGIQMFFGVEVMEALSSILRGCLVPGLGKLMASVDFSQIEARVIAWLAGDQDLLEVFLSGRDIYRVAAARIFGVAEALVTDAQRQIGKVAVLALGFGGGAGAFLSMAVNYGLKLSDAEAEQIKVDWREGNPKIVRLWYAVEGAALDAVRRPGRVTRAGMCSFEVKGGNLLVKLPSGRKLVYRDVEMDVGTFGNDAVSYMGVDQYTKQWTRIVTYGGKLVENIVQAVARDVMASAFLRLSKAGFDVLGTIHDELLFEVPGQVDFERGVDLFKEVPVWAAGLPIGAEGWMAERYRK